MPDVGRATPSWPAREGAIATPVASAKLALGQFKAQRARRGIGFGQFQLDQLALLVGLARRLANQRARGLVKAEIFIAEDRCRDQPVAAKVEHGGEEAERLDSGDPAFEDLPDPIGQEGGDITVDRLALGLHRAPLEHRDVLANLDEPLGAFGRQRAIAEPEAADQ